MDERDQVEAMAVRLRECMRKVPQSVQHGNWNAAQSFKAWSSEANKALNYKGAPLAKKQKLAAALNKYEVFQ